MSEPERVSKEQAEWNVKAYKHGAALRTWDSIGQTIPEEFYAQAQLAYWNGIQVELDIREEEKGDT